MCPVGRTTLLDLRIKINMLELCSRFTKVIFMVRILFLLYSYIKNGEFSPTVFAYCFKNGHILLRMLFLSYSYFMNIEFVSNSFLEFLEN